MNVRGALVNTLIMALTGATIVMLLGTLVAWFSVRTRSSLAKGLDLLSFMPTAVPHIVMAVAFMMLFLRTPLYGTIWAIVLAQVAIFIAFGARTMSAAMLQIHKELENAARASGATWAVTLRNVVMPLLLPQIVDGWLWVVAHSVRDLTVPLILLSTSNLVISSQLWLMWGYPNLPGVAALSMLTLIGLAVLVVPLQFVAARQKRTRA